MISRLRSMPDALKQTLLYGISIAFMKGVSLLMLPFISHQLPPEAFGQLEVIVTLAIIGSVLVGMGLERTLFRFAGAEDDLENQKKIAAEIFGLTIVIGSISWCLGIASVPKLTEWIPGSPSAYQLQLVISILALEGCIAVPLGWLRMCNRALVFSFVTTARALTHALLVVVFLLMGRGIDGVLEASLIAALSQAFMLTYLQIRSTGLAFNYKTSIGSIIYSLPLVGSGLVTFALSGLDRWILADHASLTDVAQFGVASKFALAVILLIQPYSMWWSPRRFEVLRKPDGHKLAVHYISLGLAQLFIIAALVGILSPLLIVWLLPESYYIASEYVVGLVLMLLMKEITELINLGCFNGQTTITQFAINTFAAIIGIGGMFWLAPEYSVWGIISALLFAQFVRLVLFFVASQYLLPLSYPKLPLIILTTVSMGWLMLSVLSTHFVQQLLIAIVAFISLMLLAFAVKLIPVPDSYSKKYFSL